MLLGRLVLLLVRFCYCGKLVDVWWAERKLRGFQGSALELAGDVAVDVESVFEVGSCHTDVFLFFSDHTFAF